MPKSHATIIADTVAFIPTTIPFPYSDQDTFLQQSIADILNMLRNADKLKIPRVMYGDIIRNTFTEIANILNRDKNRLNPTNNTSKEPRVIQKMCKNDSKDTMVKMDKLKENQNDTRETRVENKIEIPKLPSLQKFLKNYNKTKNHNAINHIFAENKKQSIDTLLQE